jgi:hypothetical protein
MSEHADREEFRVLFVEWRTAFEDVSDKAPHGDFSDPALAADDQARLDGIVRELGRDAGLEYLALLDAAARWTRRQLLRR